MKDAMRRRMRILRAAILGGGLVLAASAPGRAQISSGGGPIDAASVSVETIQGEHLVIYKDNVEAVQNGNRLNCDLLKVYFSGHPAPGSKPTPKAAQAPAGQAAAVGSDWGEVDHMIAEGHVYLVGTNQTARSEHAIYELSSDTITLTGDVTVVQGDNVARGDKLVIHVKDNHSEFFSAVTGRNKPGRVRTVIYNNGQTNGPASPPAAASSSPAPAAAPTTPAAPRP